MHTCHKTFFRPENWLDRTSTYVLRGICILIIVMGHVGSSSTDPLFKSEAYSHFCDATGFSNWGMWATGVFFFLSGYGMTLSLQRQGHTTWGYMGRKMKKLFEAFLFFWLVYVITFLLFDCSQLTPRLLVDFITLSMPLRVDAWFFKVILAVYLLLFLLFALPLGNRMRATIFSIVCLIYYIVMRQLGFGPWWFATTPCIVLGMWFACGANWLRRHPLPQILAFVLLFVAHYLSTAAFLPPLSFTLCTVLLTWIVPLRCRILQFIGDNSLHFYFLEEPVYHYLVVTLAFCYPLYLISTYAVILLLVWGYTTAKRRITDRTRANGA